MNMNVILRLLVGSLKIFNYLVMPIYWLISHSNRQTVPPLTDPLLKISAIDLAEKIRMKKISSEQICEAYIKRIKEVNPILNAVVEDRFDKALEEARNVDISLKTSPLKRKELEKCKPLLGVPLTIKESCSLSGMRFSVGSLTRTNIKAETDGVAVQRLKNSGAIPLLVSSTPEICLSAECTNFITGTTNNVYDTTCTSGGSSGGEGALLGSGASIIGVGSDIGGSIRLPAMFNGVFGHKPTARLVPIEGNYPYCKDEKFEDYLVIGPMTRYAKDLKLMLKIMIGEKKVNKIKLNKKVNLGDIHVYHMEEASQSVVFIPVQDEIKEAIRQSVAYLKNKFSSKIREFKFVGLNESCEIGGTLLYKLKDIPNLLGKEQNKNLVTELLKSLFRCSKFTFNLLYFYVLQVIYKNFVINDVYVRKNDNLRQLITETLKENGVLLYPAFPTSAVKHNSSVFWTDGISYLMIFNTLGLPATVVPCGLDKKRLPIAIQVIAGLNQDRLCLAVAEELETFFGNWNSFK